MYMLRDEVDYTPENDGDNFNQSSGKIVGYILWMMTAPHSKESSPHFRYQTISTIDEEPESLSGSICIQLGRKI